MSRILRSQTSSPDEAVIDLLDEIGDTAVFRVDADGHIASWNSGARRLWGYPPDEIVGRPFATLYDPEDHMRGQPEADLAAARGAGRCHSAGWRPRQDGTIFFADTTISAIAA